MNSFYNAIDINLLTSISEGFPYVIPEGGRMRLPTISSNVGGIPSLVEDEKNGLLFSPGDVDTLAKDLLRLARDPAEYTVGSILRLTEGDLAPVTCLAPEENNVCGRCGSCAARDFWAGLYAVVNDYVDRFTLADLVCAAREKSGERAE